jgi:UDP-N-acetylbacillosamine N-acetyltransferase
LKKYLIRLKIDPILSSREFMIKRVLIFGIGPFAQTVQILCNDVPTIEIAGFVVDDDYFIGQTFCGLPVYKYSHVKPNDFELILCMGYKSMRNRMSVYSRLRNEGFKFTNIIHPSATICSGFELGDNNIILPNVCIEPNVQIGSNNVVWSHSLLCHDCIIGDHNYISAKALIGGNVKIGNCSFFGNSTSTINDVTINDETYVIAGSFIFYPTEKFSKYFGNPARKVGHHEENGIEIVN